MTEPAPRSNPLHEDGQEKVCRDCEFYIGNVLTGVCRAAPPTAVIVGIMQDLAGRKQPQIGSYWPSIDANQWCGMFKADRTKALEPLGTPQVQAPLAGDAQGSA